MDITISGKKYKSTNKAPIGCNECSGCHECCTHMGDTIIQDPYDFWNFHTHMKVSGSAPVTFDLLISEDGPWELTDTGLMLLPCIKMVSPGVCSFLSKEGRCSIHSIRSGLCRMYPLARVFEVSEVSSTLQPIDSSLPTRATLPAETLSYYVLGSDLGCPKLADTPGDKILISEWIGIPNIDKYENFSLSWHSVKNTMKALSGAFSEEGLNELKQLILKIFYSASYESDFYTDFEKRMNIWNETVKKLTE